MENGMTNLQKDFRLKPIGHVRVEGEDPMTADYYLDIKTQFRSALKQLDKFSHIIVLWWAHQNDTIEIRNQKKWTTIPPYGDNTPETGIFATRSEFRPNPIAVTTCQILDLEEKKGTVKISGIDAIDKTPIIDIKAYFPICDRVRDCHIAPWLKNWPECIEDGIVWWQEQGFFDDYE
jgi:tRNA-Thr(GGU) m(6)t(6)A37 methyltransferase TsaA